MSKYSLTQRLTIGISGQAFARVVFALNTLVLIPILIRAWGLSGYGQWIALTALASYLSYSNFGLVTTSANEIIMAVGAKDEQRAKHGFQMSVNLTCFIIMPTIAIFVVGFSLLPISQMLQLSEISERIALIIVASCAMQLWFQTMRGLMAAVLYAVGSYGFAYYIAGVTKILELLGITILVVAFHGTQLGAAIVMTVCALLDLVIVTFYAMQSVPWARIDLRLFDSSWIRRQARPALGFALSNFSTQGILVQGPRVVLSAALGGQAVAIYAVYATAIRLIDQLLLMVVLPLEVEIAHSAGQRDLKKTFHLIAFGTQVSWFLFFVISVMLLTLGDTIFRVWTHSRLEFDMGLMSLFILMAAGNQTGRVGFHALVSVNKMYGTSFYMVCSAIAALIFGRLLIPYFGVAGMVIGGISGELLNSIIVILIMTRWLGVSISEFVLTIFDVGGSLGEIGIRFLRIWNRMRS